MSKEADRERLERGDVGREVEEADLPTHLPPQRRAAAAWLVSVATMGASAWHARVSYQDDIGAALQQARWDAYRRGDFYRESPNEEARAMGEEEYVASGIAYIKASVP